MPFDGSKYISASPVTQMLIESKRQVEQGWCQHATRRRGSVCMIGSFTIQDYALFSKAEDLLLKAMSSLGYPHTSVTEFNDDRLRTKPQVLEVYDRAIERSMIAA
jgi:hypothetical protein